MRFRQGIGLLPIRSAMMTTDWDVLRVAQLVADSRVPRKGRFRGGRVEPVQRVRINPSLHARPP